MTQPHSQVTQRIQQTVPKYSKKQYLPESPKAPKMLLRGYSFLVFWGCN